MQSTQAEFAETYRALPDEEIAAIYADINSLTDDARAALQAEIQNRRLDEPQLQKLHSRELRHEAQFDRMESYRRKKLAWGRLPSSPIEWIITILLGMVLVWISDMMSRHH